MAPGASAAAPAQPRKLRLLLFISSPFEECRGRRPQAAPPARGTIVKTTVRAEAGITEWTLSNGATVVLKPTTLKEDQILFRATAKGGTSLASDADFIPARVADSVAVASGVGRRRVPCGADFFPAAAQEAICR